jgi:hypothetical protein
MIYSRSRCDISPNGGCDPVFTGPSIPPIRACIVQIPECAAEVRRVANISPKSIAAKLIEHRRQLAIGTEPFRLPVIVPDRVGNRETAVMRSIFLWLIGIPIPIILLVALCTHHF